MPRIGRVFNVGNDIDHSLAEIAELVVARRRDAGARITRTPWPADHQRIDIGSFRSDSGLIARELGWKASDRAGGRAPLDARVLP